MNKIIVLSSSNTHKLKEFKEMLEPIGFTIKSMKDYNIDLDVDENGSTFEENSYIKAKALFDILKMPVIADDSGLSVECLNGLPGVKSRRFTDSGLDCDNRHKLIDELNKRNLKSSKAYFTSAITYIDEFKTITVKGILNGDVINEERGSNGFGYDTMFYLKEYNKTVGELDSDTKNEISHRHNALVKLVEELKK